MTRFDAMGCLRRFRIAAGLAVGVLACLAAGAAQPRSSPVPLPRPPGRGGGPIVCGLPGDDEHRNLFAATVERLHKALIERYGFSASEVLVRFGVDKRPGDGPALAGRAGLSNREGIAADVDELRKRLGPEDTLWVIVLGHGHYDGRHSHLEHPRPGPG